MVTDQKPSIFPISEYNLEGIKILIDNCKRMGSGDNINVTSASIDPSIWLGLLLDKHWNKISHVSTSPTFTILKILEDKIVNQTFSTITVTVISDDDLNTFFNDRKWKKLVIFSIVKIADLNTMTTYYSIRYADITEKYEERDNKIKDILDYGTNNN